MQMSYHHKIECVVGGEQRSTARKDVGKMLLLLVLHLFAVVVVAAAAGKKDGCMYEEES